MGLSRPKLLSVLKEKGKRKRVFELPCRPGSLGNKTIITAEVIASLGMIFKWDI